GARVVYERCGVYLYFFFSSRRRHTRFSRDWSSDVCSSDLILGRSSPRAWPSPCSPESEPPYETTRSEPSSMNDRKLATPSTVFRSEERRVGKECRCRGAPEPEKKRSKNAMCSIARQRTSAA